MYNEFKNSPFNNEEYEKVRQSLITKFYNLGRVKGRPKRVDIENGIKELMLEANTSLKFDGIISHNIETVFHTVTVNTVREMLFDFKRKDLLDTASIDELETIIKKCRLVLKFYRKKVKGYKPSSVIATEICLLVRYVKSIVEAALAKKIELMNTNTLKVGSINDYRTEIGKLNIILHKVLSQQNTSDIKQ